jgi:hypothetical protein
VNPPRREGSARSSPLPFPAAGRAEECERYFFASSSFTFLMTSNASAT